MADGDNIMINNDAISATSSATRAGNAGPSHEASGNFAHREADQVRLGVSQGNAFPHKLRHRGVRAGGYGPGCLPLGLRDGNVAAMNQNPTRRTPLSSNSSNLLGNSGHNVRSFAANSSNFLCDVNEESCNVNFRRSHMSSQQLCQSPQTRNRIGSNDTRWAHPVHNRFTTSALPGSSGFTQFLASKGESNMLARAPLLNPSGGSILNRTDNVLDTKSDQLFRDPDVPRHQNWSHFETVPSIVPSTLNGSDNGSQSIHLPGSTASHCNTRSNHSHCPGNGQESFPSRFTSPLHSANIHTRRVKKRPLSMSPSISEGLDLNSIIRLSPTSLFTWLLSRHSSSSGSPQPGHQGSFSHLSARNTSPFFQHGSGHRGLGYTTSPFNVFPAENNLMEEIMSNAYVATKDEMPYVEQNYYSGNLPNDFSEIKTRQANGLQGCSCVTCDGSQAGNFTSAAVHSNCVFSHGTDSIAPPFNETVRRFSNSDMCMSGVPPFASNDDSGRHNHPHCIHQPLIHQHYLQRQHRHVTSRSGTQASHSYNDHPYQYQHLEAEQAAQEISNVDQFHRTTTSRANQRLLVNHAVATFSRAELHTLNGLSANLAANSSIPSVTMDAVFSNEDSIQADGSVVAGIEECEGDDPMVCLWKDCGLMFRHPQQLGRHVEKAHVDQRKGDDFTCLWTNCPRNTRPFNARYKLVIHIRVHSGEKPHKCLADGCTSAFSRLENLKIHLRSHTGERPYVCEHTGCEKAFSNSSDRAKHKKTHIDTHPYVCQTSGCGHRYTDPSSLRKHAKNHSSGQLHQQRQKKKLKKESPAGGPVLSSCLTVHRLQPEGCPTEMSDLLGSPHAGSNSEAFHDSGFTRSVSSRCGTASVGSSMSVQPSPGNLGILEENNESMDGLGSVLSPQPLPPIPHQMRPDSASMYREEYDQRRQMLPFSQHVTHLPSIMPQQQQHQQQQLQRPHYPQNFTSFSSCRVGAMQGQRMMMRGFDPGSFNLPLDGLVQSGFPDAGHLASLESPGAPNDVSMQEYLQLSLESPGAPNDVSMQEYLQLSAIGRGNSHTSIYADGST